MKKTMTLTAWCCDKNHLAHIYSDQNENQWGLNFTNHNMESVGWFRLGTATIHLDLVEPKDTVAMQVEALEAEIKSTQAECERTLTQLRARIGELLAIENGGGER